MIDYEKLKQAHELASKCKSHYLLQIISHKGAEFTLVDWKPDIPDMNFFDEDSLIEKLTELTQPKSKYEVGQTIWFMDCEKNIREFIINTVEILGYEGDLYRYRDHSGNYVYERDGLYSSRDALIESQIQYWQSFLKPDSQMSCSEAIRKHHELEDDCQHISDGIMYQINQPVFHLDGKCDFPLPHNKCRKCGDFYK